MKKLLLLSSFVLLFIACGGVKKTQEALNVGNYNNAINSSLSNLAENKSKKSNQPYILLLEEAYKKNTERELEEIAFLRKDNNPANLEKIYDSYTQLKNIQERIKPLLPLYLRDENRNARFSFNNYDEKILRVKQELADYLYDNASYLLSNASSKADYRKAYEDFVYLDKINPGYGDCKEKQEEAYTKGRDFVMVRMINDSDQIIPSRLEEELLNFNTYGINNLWTEYHAQPLKNIKYDYEMEVAFRSIVISPEKVSEKQISKEKQIKDGYRYAEDANGNILKDSLGNEIKIDNFKTVRCDFHQFTQFKAAQVVGNVSFKDLRTKQTINNYPLASEFVFEHIYANYQGDKRALETDLLNLIGVVSVPFPSNEQMVYDAGEDVKGKLKNILQNQRFN
ncbi:hypothetical protein [Sediminicola sp. 1XM1-17]|uniref:hypothetical protein n=1 Tax=Sediminicola sp. 1XM1-17 TaxID=3127702 RepID=UPI003078A379